MTYSHQVMPKYASQEMQGEKTKFGEAKTVISLVVFTHIIKKKSNNKSAKKAKSNSSSTKWTKSSRVQRLFATL